MHATRASFRRAYTILEPSACLRCQWRSFSISRKRIAAEKQDTSASASSPGPAPTSSSSTPSSPLENAPRRYGKAVEEFTPRPLSRPIGLPDPPSPGENTGIDTRSWRQKREDMVNYDKHLQRRKELKKKISAPYFRDWSNMRLHKGKTFLAPPGLFKAEKALYFPNLSGRTLLKDPEEMDTTPVLEDKVSIVSIFSSAWAEKQVASFIGEKEHPELHQAIKEGKSLTQLVHINVEEDIMKAMLIRLFISSLRRTIGEANWGKYFIVRRGISDALREEIGYLNSKVGYIYLLDGDCRIRWAASGNAEGSEKEGLVKGVRKLVEDIRSKRTTRAGDVSKAKKTSLEKDDLTTQNSVATAT